MNKDPLIVKFRSGDWSPFNIQQCTSLPRQLIDPLNPYLSHIEEYLSIDLTPVAENKGNCNISTRALIRISATSTQETECEGPQPLVCDMRVREICVTADLEAFILKRFPKFAATDAMIALILQDVLRGFWDWSQMFQMKIPEVKCQDVAEGFPCQLLKVGVIRKMSVTVIFRDLSLGDHNDQVSEELVRQCFKIYSLYVRANTIIDVRCCPFLSSTLTPISFIFVHECVIPSTQAPIGRLSSQTELRIRRNHDVPFFQRILLTLKNNGDDFLHGLEFPLRTINSALEIHQAENRNRAKHFYSGFILSGAAGSGKKLVVREVTLRHGAKLLDLNLAAEEFQQGYRSTSGKLTKIFDEASQSTSKFGYPIVILLENLDVLHVKEDGLVTRGVANKKLITNHLCDLLDDAGADLSTSAPLVVIGTTSKPYLIPDKLKMCYRMPQEIFIKVPNVIQRIGILKSLQLKNPKLRSLDVELLGKRTPGYVAKDVINVAHVATLQANITGAAEVTEKHIKYALTRVLPSVLQGSVGVVDIQRDSSALENVSGLDSVKMDLIKTIVWPLIAPEAFRRMGITPPKGIILYGPSGCGKTTLVRAVASAHQTNFLSVSSAELFCSGVGDSEKIIAHLFHRARLASPCVLFIDELDAVVGSRDSKSGKSVSETILSTLLTEMDGVGIRSGGARTSFQNESDEADAPFESRVVVVGATNRPDMIDSALLRPGRFDRLVPVPPPNEDDRLKLFRNSLKKTKLGDDVRLEELAAKTERFSGADIVNLCREAGLHALSEDINIPCVAMSHYLKALDHLSPSISKEYLNSFYQFTSRGSFVQDMTRQMNSLNLRSSK